MMKQAFSERKSDECIRLKIRMLQRRLTYQDVAKMAGIHPRVVSNVLCGNDRNWPPRDAINRAFVEKIFTEKGRSRSRSSRKRTPAASAPLPASTPPPAHSID
jgi:transcriptional regulator with XRE-family HTH domain